MTIDTILCIVGAVLLLINSAVVYLLIKQNRETEWLIEHLGDTGEQEEP